MENLADFYIEIMESEDDLKNVFVKDIAGNIIDVYQYYLEKYNR